MTQEQFKRAVQISDKLEALNETKERIKETEKHRLWYAYKSEPGRDWELRPEWLMGFIYDILEKHDVMIRQEIDEEIERLKAEIETL